MAHWRTRGKKITLGGAAERGDVVALLFYCLNGRVHYGGCFHSGSMPIADALERWPHDWCLDRLPVRCSKCGSREIDVRAQHEHTPQGPFIWKDADRYPERRAVELIGELAQYLNALRLPPIS